MSASLHVGVTTSPFERVVADVAIAGFFQSERPLRGAAGRADWRLCGLVSDLLADGRLREKTGAAVLVPGAGRLAADRVMLVGLGRRPRLDAARVHEASAAAIRRGILLGARRLALAPPTGDAAVADHAGALLRGAVHAVSEADAEVELSLVVAEREAVALQRALQDALEAVPSPAVQLVPAGHAEGAPGGGLGFPGGQRPAARRPVSRAR